eukprot:7314170-Prymnesium_polylepis.1
MGRMGGDSIQASGIAARRMVRSCGRVSTPSPESGRIRQSVPAASRSRIIARIDGPACHMEGRCVWRMEGRCVCGVWRG